MIFSAIIAIVEAKSPKPYLFKNYKDGPEISTIPQCQEPDVLKCKKLQLKEKRIPNLKSGKTISLRPNLDIVLKVKLKFLDAIASQLLGYESLKVRPSVNT